MAGEGAPTRSGELETRPTMPTAPSSVVGRCVGASAARGIDRVGSRPRAGLVETTECGRALPVDHGPATTGRSSAIHPETPPRTL